MIRPTSLEVLERQGHAIREGGALRFRVQRDWAIPTEDRLGYAAIVQMFECVREYHWELDVATRTSRAIDSITRSLAITFVSPVYVEHDILGHYNIASARRSSYELSIRLLDQHDSQPLAVGTIVSVFYDPALRRACEPPNSVARYLAAASSSSVDS